MRIALVSSTALETPPPRYGGLERIVWDLSCRLAELGHEVTLFACQGSRTPPGGRFVPFGQRDGRLFLDPDQLLAHDAIHFHEWSPLSAQLARLHPERCIFQTWHGPSIGAWAGWRRPPKNLVVVGVSHYHAEELSAELGIECEAVPNGIHLEDYPLYTGPREPYIAWVARICHEKGLHRAIRVAEQTGMVLRVAGSEHIGADPEYTRAMLARCDGRRVVYEGDLGLEDKVELMRHASVLLHPAPGFLEPFGMAPVEAMACGTPVVSYATGAVAETVAEGGVLVVRPDELPGAIREAMRIAPEACRANAERYDDRAMAQAYLGLYGKVREATAAALA
jgi:glycosyltransferase involved in cell wall biosynthesis